MDRVLAFSKDVIALVAVDKELFSCWYLWSVISQTGRTITHFSVACAQEEYVASAKQLKKKMRKVSLAHPVWTMLHVVYFIY